jgi:hypothetical protein
MSTPARTSATSTTSRYFATPDAADEWFEENDPEGVAFEYPVNPSGLGD